MEAEIKKIVSNYFANEEIENIGIFNGRVIVTLQNAQVDDEKTARIENEIKAIEGIYKDMVDEL